MISAKVYILRATCQHLAFLLFQSNHMKTCFLLFIILLNCNVFSCLSVTFTWFYFSYFNFFTRPSRTRSYLGLCILSCHHYCSLFACYYHFMLCLFMWFMSDNSSCSYYYLLTLPVVKWISYFPYHHSVIGTVRLVEIHPCNQTRPIHARVLLPISLYPMMARCLKRHAISLDGIHPGC